MGSRLLSLGDLLSSAPEPELESTAAGFDDGGGGMLWRRQEPRQRTLLLQ